MFVASVVSLKCRYLQHPQSKMYLCTGYADNGNGGDIGYSAYSEDNGDSDDSLAIIVMIHSNASDDTLVMTVMIYY